MLHGEINQKVAECINGDTSLGYQLKRRATKCTCLVVRSLTVKICDQKIVTKETKNLYSHLMALTRSNRDMDQNITIGIFTLALFAPDGPMLMCTDK